MTFSDCQTSNCECITAYIIDIIVDKLITDSHKMLHIRIRKHFIANNLLVYIHMI